VEPKLIGDEKKLEVKDEVVGGEKFDEDEVKEENTSCSLKGK